MALDTVSSRRRSPALVAAAIAFGALVVAGLIAVGLWNYLVFHWLAEGFSIVVAFSIFLVVWHARDHLDNGWLRVLGAAFLFVGGLDFVHSMVFKSNGLQLVPVGTDPPTQIWIAARAMQAISLLGAIAFFRRRPGMAPLLAGYGIASALILLCVFVWKIFPSCLPEGGPLTAFKQVAEAAIVAVLAGAWALLRRFRGRFDARVYRGLAWALAISMASELAFVLYRDTWDLFNMAGHLLKVAAFFLIYRAIVRTAFQRPLDLLFHDLKQSRDALRRAGEALEARVQERTEDLANTVETLHKEMEARTQAEKRLCAINSLLALFASKSGRKEYLDAVVRLLHETSGCRCVGVRLRNEQGDVPYEASVGFSEDFLAKESRLCLERDQCLCTRLIAGRPAPSDAPGLTPGGSFASQDSMRFVAGLTPEEAKSYRGVCMRTGFATLAIVPIRHGGKTLGAVHLADERKGLAPPSIVSFVEGVLSPLIGEAIHRLETEETLRKERQKFFSVLNILPGFVALKDADHRVRFANHKFHELFHPLEGKPCHEIQRGLDRPCDDCQLNEVLRARRPLDAERAYTDGRFYHVWLYPFADADGTELVLELGLDVTAQKHLEQQVLHASEHDRRRLGKDMHESLGQKLAGLAFLLEGMLRKHGDAGSQERAEAERALAVLKESVTQVRDLTKDLDPVDLGGAGFLAGMADLASTAQATHGVRCRFQHDGEAHVTDQMTATHLYYIAREAVTNAVRHGHAKNIEIRLEKEDGGVTLWVTDDGNGFDLAVLGRTKGMGVRAMRYRAGAIRGTLSVSRAPQGGTNVCCRLGGPISPQENRT